MVDMLSPKARSDNMRAIKSKDTKPEVLVRKLLHAHGFRYRKNYNKLPGKPDIVFQKYKAVIQVQGCYWHCHPNCHLSHIPDNNKEYWLSKFQANINRDERTFGELVKLGWRVMYLWECAIVGKTKIPQSELVPFIEVWIKNGFGSVSISGV